MSWVRLKEPIPQLMSLNNMTNTLNPRYEDGWTWIKNKGMIFNDRNLVQPLAQKDKGPVPCLSYREDWDLGGSYHRVLADKVWGIWRITTKIYHSEVSNPFYKNV